MAKSSNPKPEQKPDNIIHGKFGRTYPPGTVPPKDPKSPKDKEQKPKAS